MVSAVSDTENLSLSFKYGISGFISKPFTKSTVYEKLANIFGKEMPRTIPAKIFRCGGLPCLRGYP